MSVSTPPPPAAPRKKSVLGCLGCGCGLLLLLFLLFAGLIVGSCYYGYEKLSGFTSATAADIPAYSGGDDVFNSAQQKVNEFNDDLQNHQASSLQLSADEINALLTHDPDLIKAQARIFVTLTNDQAQVQGSIPTNAFLEGLLKDRYINFDTTFGLGFNTDAKNIDLALHHLQVGDQTMPDKMLPTLQAEIIAILNAEVQKDPVGKNLLQQAKTIQIKDGLLDIETQ
jgi:hypothetical protein